MGTYLPYKWLPTFPISGYLPSSSKFLISPFQRMTSGGCVGVWMIHAPPVGKIWPGLSHKYSGPASRPAPEDITQPAESPLAPNQCSINSWNSAMPRCLLDLISKEKLNLDVLNNKSFQHVLSSCKHFFNDLHMNLKETLSTALSPDCIFIYFDFHAEIWSLLAWEWFPNLISFQHYSQVFALRRKLWRKSCLCLRRVFYPVRAGDKSDQW